MKVWLDDERDPPDGWVWAKTAQEAVDLLRTGKVSEISLDHDLGDNEAGTGYDVISWLEWRVIGPFTREIDLPVIHIHTANPVGRKRMEKVLEKLKEGK